MRAGQLYQLTKQIGEKNKAQKYAKKGKFSLCGNRFSIVACFTCVTSANVQILTHKSIQEIQHKAGRERVQAVWGKAARGGGGGGTVMVSILGML